MNTIMTDNKATTRATTKATATASASLPFHSTINKNNNNNNNNSSSSNQNISTIGATTDNVTVQCHQHSKSNLEASINESSSNGTVASSPFFTSESTTTLSSPSFDCSIASAMETIQLDDTNVAEVAEVAVPATSITTTSHSTLSSTIAISNKINDSINNYNDNQRQLSPQAKRTSSMSTDTINDHDHLGYDESDVDEEKPIDAFSDDNDCNHHHDDDDDDDDDGGGDGGEGGGGDDEGCDHGDCEDCQSPFGIFFNNSNKTTEKTSRTTATTHQFNQSNLKTITTTTTTTTLMKRTMFEKKNSSRSSISSSSSSSSLSSIKTIMKPKTTPSTSTKPSSSSLSSLSSADGSSSSSSTSSSTSSSRSSSLSSLIPSLSSTQLMSSSTPTASISRTINGIIMPKAKTFRRTQSTPALVRIADNAITTTTTTTATTTTISISTTNDLHENGEHKCNKNEICDKKSMLNILTICKGNYNKIDNCDVSNVQQDQQLKQVPLAIIQQQQQSNHHNHQTPIMQQQHQIPAPPTPLSSATSQKLLQQHSDQRFGCAHYKRRAMFVTPCCNKFYKCRFCHDENETHHFDRKTLTELICSECNTRQRVQERCENCGVRFGKYTCLICNLFDDADKQQYHCDACGICRIGGAENFFHCEVCNMCLPIQLKIDGHRCVENVSRSHCPVCLGDIHTSRIPCHIPDCGHLLHKMCFDQLLNSGHYTCPTCQTSLIDMTALWDYLDEQALRMPIPHKYKNETINIFCNDCHKTSKTKFHFIGLKCMECGAYNTTQDVKRRMSLVTDEPTSA